MNYYKSKEKKRINMRMISFAVMALIFFQACGIANENYVEPVEIVLDMEIKHDTEAAGKFIDIVPEPAVDMTVNLLGYSSKEDMEEDFASSYETQYSSYEGSEEYEISNERRMDQDEIDELEGEYSERDIDLDIEDAYEIGVNLYSVMDMDLVEADLVSVKVDGNWYIDIISYVDMTETIYRTWAEENGIDWDDLVDYVSQF